MGIVIVIKFFTKALIGEIVVEYESMDDKFEPSGVAITERDMYKI